MKKRVLITGIAGFIGFSLAKQLRDNTDYEIVGIDNLNNYYDVNLKKNRLSQLGDIDFKQMDISDKPAISELFRDQQFDIVVNLAAQAGVRYSIDHPDVYLSSNIIGFFNILEACRTHKPAHLIYASSSSVYGNQPKTPFSETDDVSMPISLYAATKKSDELMAYTYSHLYNLRITGLRFFTVYGPWGRPDMAYYKFADAISKGETIPVFNNGDLMRDFTFIDDIVSGVIKVIESDKGPTVDPGSTHKIYNIGNNSPVKLLDFIQVIEKALGKTSQKKFLPMQLGDVYQTFADISEIKRDFGFAPTTPIAQGIEKFIDWYQQYAQENK